MVTIKEIDDLIEKHKVKNGSVLIRVTPNFYDDLDELLKRSSNASDNDFNKVCIQCGKKAIDTTNTTRRIVCPDCQGEPIKKFNKK